MRGKPTSWCCLILAAAASAGCGASGGAGGIRLIGLANAPCDKASSALFGAVPVLVEPTGAIPLTGVSVTANDGAPVSSSTAPFVVQLDTSQIKDGTARIEATATDNDGESHSVAIQVCVDNAGPTLTVLSPADGAAVGLEDAAVKVRVRASDPAGVDSVVAHVSVAGVHQTVECKPPGASDLECTIVPSDLGVTIAPKSSSPMTLTVTARDTWGREARAQRKLTVSTRLLWSYYTGGAISWAAVPLAGGNVAVGNDIGSVHVLDSTGTNVCSWTAPPIGGKAEGVATPLSANGTTLYFASTQRVYGFDATTCAASWTATSGLYFASQPDHDAATGMTYIGSYGALTTKGSLLAFSSTGASAGSYGITAAVNEAVTGGVALSTDGKTAYIGSSDFKLYALDVTSPASIALRWTYTTGAKIETQPLVTATRIYLAGLDKAIHAIDPTTGKKDPTFNFTAQAGFLSAPVLGSNGLLYAGSLDLYLYAIDSTGKVKASYETGRMMRASPAIGPSGIVYAVLVDPGRLYALSPDLKLLWSISPGTSIKDQIKGSPAVGGNTVYVGSTNGYLYALDATPPSS